MCCEEHHICLHCNTLITSHIDRCVAYHHPRNPGTEFGMLPADDWCPEEEWIVEEFLHADDGLCPRCAAATNLSCFPVDGLSGEVVHPPMALHSKNNSAGDGIPTPSGSPTSSSDDGGSAGGKKKKVKVAAAPRSGGGAGMGWRMRVRNIVAGTRLASKARDDDDDDDDSSGDEPPTAMIREQVSADKREGHQGGEEVGQLGGRRDSGPVPGA